MIFVLHAELEACLLVDQIQGHIGNDDLIQTLCGDLH